MNSNQTTAVPSIVRLLATLGLVFALGVCGCAGRGQGKFARTTAIAGFELSPTTLGAIDIVNPNGSVRVVIDPREPGARWEWNITADSSVPPATLAALKADGMHGAVVVEGGRNIVRIRPTQEMVDTPGMHVAVTVFAPSCRGVYIRSTGGAIQLVNVSGPMSITNGLNGGPGGNVIVRTNEPLVDPIWIETPSGNVDLFMPPLSRGVFELRSDDGTADFYAVGGTLDRVRVTPQTWTGTLNSGQNQVVLRSGRGRVRGLVDARPEAAWRTSNEPRDWNP